MLVAQRIDQLAVRHHAAQAEQQAFAAHLGDHARETILDLGEPLLEQQADLADVVEEALFQHHVEGRIAGRHRERIAAEGRAVRARQHALAGILGGEERADRKAAAKRLGERHHVGLDAGALVGEQLAGAAHAGLHLVEDQQQAVLVAQRAQAFEKLVGVHRTPPSPWIGSIRIAAVSGPMAFFTASRSPNGTWSKPSTTGPKPSRYFLFARRPRGSRACGRGTRLQR